MRRYIPYLSNEVLRFKVYEGQVENLASCIYFQPELEDHKW